MVAVEVNTISELRDSFLAAKGFDSGESFSVTEEIYNEFLDFIKINDNQVAMILKKKTRCKETVTFGRNKGVAELQAQISTGFVITNCTNTDNTLKDLLGYCPLSVERHYNLNGVMKRRNQPWTSTAKKLKKVHKELCL